MTTGVLSLETETRTSFWVATNRPHSGGGSEVLAILFHVLERKNKVSNCFVKVVQGWALGTKSANPHPIVRPPQSVDKEHKQK